MDKARDENPSFWPDTLQYVINRFLFWFHFICNEREKKQQQQHIIHMLALLVVCTVCNITYAYSSRRNNIGQHLQRIMPTTTPVKP